MQAGYYQKGGDYTKGLCARWLGKWVADCSGLIKSVRGSLSGVYRDVSAQGTYGQCTKTGTIATMPMTPGCCVFVWSASKHRMGHVGVYVGGGWVIQSAGVRYGVIKTKLKGWTHWGLPDWLTYDIPTETTPLDGGGTPDYTGDNTGPKLGDPPYPANLPPQVGVGSTGDTVKTLQKLLNAMGARPKLAIDGDFGPLTLSAVIAFQKAHSLVADGIVGPKTWTALMQ
jgi:cell wall-associated NlpC family hydrolase